MRLLWLLCALACLLCSDYALAGPWKLQGQATARATGTPGFLGIEVTGMPVAGTAELDADGTLSKAEMLAEVKDAEAGSGVFALRTHHMRTRHLETATYPTARLSLDPFKVTGGEDKWCGKLTLKAETHPVCGTARVSSLLNKKSVDASFLLKLSDFPSFGKPKHAGVGVDDEVTVTVKAEASPQ